MPPTRYLGSAWAAVHGPVDPRRLCIWTLERGFRGLLPAPTPRPIDWPAVRAAATDLPFDLAGTWRLAALSVAEERPERGLASRNAGEQTNARNAVRAGVAGATALGLRRLVLEPGAVPMPGERGPSDLADPSVDWTPDRIGAQVARRKAGETRALDLACRALFELTRASPDLVFCLTASRTIDGLGTPSSLGLIFEDLPRVRLAYWHETAVCACRQDRLGEPQGEWLERFGHKLAGASLGDWSEGRLHAPPGSGLVDHALLASYLSGVGDRFPVVLELDPAVPPAELAGVRSYLEKFGL
ncbi:MAG: hypothetical protein HZB39_16695 [Planctomycetes bacterium]|nr:hypothetical protein [Planctomycetota bacterium]